LGIFAKAKIIGAKKYMGNCGLTEVFDPVIKVLLDNKQVKRKKVIKVLIQALEQKDWDCQTDSVYYEHPLVNKVFRDLYAEEEGDKIFD
jgi:hypothetical protein